jgi:radical SAM superfamily enzyme YgiQ (UPF0313 family)
MKILLISPCADPSARTLRIFFIPQLSLHVIASLTPHEHEVKIVEEEREDIDLESDVDLVGISCFTSNAPRAYYLAQEFRKRGKKVVMGGVHPSILPDEALHYADSVVIGEAEEVWEELLSDFVRGTLKDRYTGRGASLDRYVPLRFEASTKKLWFNLLPVMTTRGCPYNCEFCCVFDVYGRTIRHVPVENVVRQIAEAGGKICLFLDDNIIGDPPYAKELFAALTDLKIRWAGQASLSFVKDDEMMRLAAKSGCAALFFGVESVSQGNLTRMAKAIKDVSGIEEAIKKVHDHGILFHPSFILGFDNDTRDIFPETLEFIFRNRIGTAGFNVLTPYPGTKIYEQFRREGRIITTDWRYYNLKHVVFRPRHMSPFELHTGRFWLIKEFTKLSTIARNWRGIPSNNFGVLLGIYFAFNLGYRKEINEDVGKFPAIAPMLFPGEIGHGGNDVDTRVRSSFESYARLHNNLKLQKKGNS